MNPTPYQKNIVYGTITAGGDVHIGDNYYTVETAFKHSILFLRIENTEGGQYALNLSIKSKHTTQGALNSSGENLLHEAVSVHIAPQLFDDLAEFQTFRRSVDTQTRYKGVARHDSRSVQLLENSLSQQLFHTFFSGDIGQVCADFIELLEARRIEELLLAISTDDDTIINLPFEMVLPLLFPAKFGETKKSLATSAFGLVRTKTKGLSTFNMQGDHATAAPLKMLFITALPDNLDESGKMLQIEEEQTRLIQAIGSLEATGDALPKIVIEFLDNASLEELNKVLKARQHDIVHISGHGAYQQAENKGVLYFENEEGDALKVTGAQLGETLRQHACVKLLILSACETAIAGSEGGVTEQAAAFNVPSIVAMRFAVTDEGAKVFTTELYTHLAKGASLTRALSYARETLHQAILRERAQTPHRLHIAEWFTPVVYHNQYVGSLISKTETYHLPDNFYPLSSFLKTTKSRLIGEGFIGRKRYLIRMRRAFQSGEHICLHGLGGLGKTTLAEAFAHHYASYENGEVILFRGGSQINEKYILDELIRRYEQTSTDKNRVHQLKTLVDNPQTDVLEKLQTVMSNYLNRRKTILIFDNVEDVQIGEGGEVQRTIASEGLSAFLRHLCDNTPKNCHILFTTRYKIENLADVVEHIALDKMGYAEQYRLLNYSEILRGIPLADRDAVYNRLDGHPRGYEYLEALLKKDKSFTWQQVADSEAKVFADLLLVKVYDRLTDKEKAIFQIISVFITRTPLVALAAVSEENEVDLLPVLQSLQDWSLCFLEKDGRFEVHRLTREWMRENVTPSVKIKEWALKAGEYFANINYGGKYDMNDLLLSRDYYEIGEDWGEYALMSFDIHSSYMLYGFFEQALQVVGGVAMKELDNSIHAMALLKLGVTFQSVGQNDKAIKYYEMAVDIWQNSNDELNESIGLFHIAGVHLSKGFIADAEKYLEQSLKIREKRDDKGGLAACFHYKGVICRQKNDYENAELYLNNLVFANFLKVIRFTFLILFY
jgi:tetratricopeptide (TPR) repeat protein